MNDKDANGSQLQAEAAKQQQTGEDRLGCSM